MWGEAFWAWRCSARTFGSGWPRFLCSFTKSCFSWVSKLRKAGPCSGTGGGAQPSHQLELPVCLCNADPLGSEVPDSGTTASSGITGFFSRLEALDTLFGLGFIAWLSIVVVPKLVMVSLLGTLARILWRRRRLNQFSEPKSWMVSWERCRQTVCLMGHCGPSVMRIGIWNVSVPRHTKDCWMVISGTSDCMMPNVFPTRGAIWLASRKASLHRSDDVEGSRLRDGAATARRLQRFPLHTSRLKWEYFMKTTLPVDNAVVCIFMKFCLSWRKCIWRCMVCKHASYNIHIRVMLHAHGYSSRFKQCRFQRFRSASRLWI